MRITLPESSARRQRSAAGTLASAVIHAVLIGGTLVATGMSAEERPARTAPPETLVFLKADPARERRVGAPPGASPPEATALRPPLQPTPLPDIVVDPTVVPTVIPDVAERLAGVFDAVTARGLAATDAAGAAGAGTGGSGDAGPLTALTVDREVVPRSVITPRYPAQLASAGVEGTVLAQFVVDTLGRVEQGSIVMLRADHRLFEASVRDALARTRFVPAEAAGRTVRQLVQQPFTFSLVRE